MRRLYSASDVRAYARCRRQWWYERRAAEWAALAPAEIERRMGALRRRHGARTGDMPVYRLLDDLAARGERLERGRHAHRAHAARALRPAGCLPAVGLLALCLLPLFQLRRYT